MRKRRERDRARRTSQTAGERQVTSQERSTRERERMAAETPEEREGRLQWMSTNQHERLAAETPEERERRLQPLLKCITRRILYHIETVNYHSILCKIILVQHVNYSGRTCKFSANLSFAVHLMKYVQSDVMCHNKRT